jgi:hypothetical protein
MLSVHPDNPLFSLPVFVRLHIFPKHNAVEIAIIAPIVHARSTPIGLFPFPLKIEMFLKNTPTPITFPISNNVAENKPKFRESCLLLMIFVCDVDLLMSII